MSSKQKRKFFSFEPFSVLKETSIFLIVTIMPPYCCCLCRRDRDRDREAEKYKSRAPPPPSSSSHGVTQLPPPALTFSSLHDLSPIRSPPRSPSPLPLPLSPPSRHHPRTSRSRSHERPSRTRSPLQRRHSVSLLLL